MGVRRAAGRVAVLAALSAAVAGLVLLAAARASRVLARAELGAVTLELDRLGWVRHGVDATPPSMMPGMPARGRHRLHVELTLHNRGAAARFSAGELLLRHADGEEQPPQLSETPEAEVGRGQLLATSVDFE